MSAERIEAELSLLRGWFGSDLEHLPDSNWVCVRTYEIPSEVWTPRVVAVSFQIPTGIPGEQPYGFYVSPGIEAGGATIGNYEYPVATGFGADWGKFSWSPIEWTPTAEMADGSNMLDFARSFADRFREGP